MVDRKSREVEFSISYDGEALAQHTMDVRDLAPALISLGQSFERANTLLNGDRASVSLSVRATQPGSFEISLILDQLFDRASDVLCGDLMTSAFVLKELLIGGRGGGIVGLIQFLKRLKGKKPKKISETNNTITFEADNVRITIPSDVARLYYDKPVRDNVEAVMRPLSKRGIEAVLFKEKGKEIESITKPEVDYFNSEEYDSDNIAEHVIPSQRLQITSLTFDKEGKWRLSDGANIHWYAMDDQDFIKEIQRGKRFGKDDILICEVLLTQRIEDTGKLRLDYAVKKVLKHITPAKQMPFPDNTITG